MDVGLKAEVDGGNTERRVEQVIALILRVAHAELLADVLRQRMNLEAEVAAAHRVEEVEADGKLSPEAPVDRIAKQLARVQENQVDRRQLKSILAEAQQQAVFLRHA